MIKFVKIINEETAMPSTDNTSERSLLTRLQELVQETDFEFVVELIDIYLAETPAQIQTIAKALNSQDYHMLNIAAHTLKGSSLNLGAKTLGAACLKLEEIARSGKSIPVGINTKEIENEFEQAKTMLLSFKSSKQ
jgi:HPt (histidine-containing phosphotransfer) domain-containing protein